MIFPKKLKELRTMNNLTQVELAEIFNVHGMTVSRWERGVAYPDIKTAVKLASLFSVSTDELLCVGEGVDDKCHI